MLITEEKGSLNGSNNDIQLPIFKEFIQEPYFESDYFLALTVSILFQVLMVYNNV